MIYLKCTDQITSRPSTTLGHYTDVDQCAVSPENTNINQYKDNLNEFFLVK